MLKSFLQATVLATLLSLLLSSDAAEIKPGDTVAVTKDQTPLKVQATVKTHLTKGTELTVSSVQGDWIGGSVVIGEKRLTGWVKRSSVQLPSAQAIGEFAWKTTERLLLSAEEAAAAKERSVIVSPHGKRVAYVQEVNKDGETREALVVDRKPEKVFWRVDRVKFSNDGQHYCYVGKELGKQTVVLDGVEIKTYLEISSGILEFVGDQFAYMLLALDHDYKHCIDVNGHCTKLDGIPLYKSFITTSDLAHYAFVVMRDGGGNLYLDGEVEASSPGPIHGAILSDDGNIVAYIENGRGSKTERAVIGGKKGPVFTRIGSRMSRMDMGFSLGSAIIRSSDRKRYMYPAELRDDSDGQERFFMVVDGNTMDLPGYAFTSPRFSPNSEHWVAWCMVDEKRVLFVDGKPYGTMHHSESPVKFNADGQHFAFVADDGDKQFVVLDNFGRHEHNAVSPDVVASDVDLKRPAFLGAKRATGEPYGKLYNHASRCVFSPDGQHFAYVAGDGDSYFVVLDGVEQQRHGVMPTDVKFSPDSERLVYIAKDSKDGKAFVVVDGTPAPQYDEITWLTFTADSKSFRYVVKDGDKEFLVVDGRERPYYDDVAPRPNGTVTLFGTDIISYVAIKDGAYYWVEEHRVPK